MADFDLDLSGAEQLQGKLERLKQQNDDPPAFVVGTNVEYAVYLEFGTEKMPAYPFFEPAVRQARRDPEGFIQDNTNFSGIDEIDSAGELVTALASALETQIKKNATAQSGDRSPGVDPEHPKVQTGNLRSSIQAVRVD